jgi:hypothetical protein
VTLAAFPPDINQDVLDDAYSSTPDINLASYKPDPNVGMPSLLRRSSILQDVLTCKMWFSSAEWEIFRSFYRDTLLDGTQGFTWVHPRTKATGTFQFEGPAPKLVANVGIDLYEAAFTIRTGVFPAGSGIVVPGITREIMDVIFVMDGVGSVIPAGMQGYLEIDFAGTITKATLLADQVGSIVVDIFKCTYSQFDASGTHPVVGDSITASSKPTISSGTKYQDATLTGWTTALVSGTVLGFNVNSASTITRLTVTLEVIKT